MLDHYILRDKKPILCRNPLTWASWMGSNDRVVGKTEIGGILRVSTVFLGLDHNFFDTGPPVLFETMIFDDNDDNYQTRCCTWDEAERMHALAVEIAESRFRDAEAALARVIVNTGTQA